MEEDPVSPEEQKTLVEFSVTRAKTGTSAAHDAALQFRPRPSDVIITTAAKAGTTWMSQICHQLRTGGHMEFKEITEVVPFMEMALDLGLNCDDEQVAEPRLFKTHMDGETCGEVGKFITVMRHPYDIAPSAYKFLDGWMFETGAISPNTFIQQVWLKRSMPQAGGTRSTQRGPCFHFFMSWWRRRHEDNVLIVFYEDMRENLEREVRRVAKFIGVTDPDAIRVAVERSAYQFMYDHRTQFDDNLLKSKRNKDMGLSADAGSSQGKISTGGGKRDMMNSTTRALIDHAWNEVCLPVTGAKNYDEWIEMWRKESATC